jgi:hypothetical protein
VRKKKKGISHMQTQQNRIKKAKTRFAEGIAGKTEKQRIAWRGKRTNKRQVEGGVSHRRKSVAVCHCFSADE